jgi:hypothetical protein
MARTSKRAAKAKAASRRKVTKPLNESVLIRECVVYAQSIAAQSAGFRADGDGDMVHAVALGRLQSSRAKQALARISSMHAETAEGLQAKARILTIVLDDSEGSLEIYDAAFLVAFATDVKNFLTPIIEKNWAADFAAKRNAP